LIAVAEETHFESVEEGHQPSFRVDDRRHDDEGPVPGPDASAHPELWKLARRNLRGDDEIEQADDQLAQRKDDHNCDEPEPDGRSAMPVSVVEEARDASPDRDGDHPEISDRRVPEDKACDPLAQLRPVPDLL